MALIILDEFYDLYSDYSIIIVIIKNQKFKKLNRNHINWKLKSINCYQKDVTWNKYNNIWYLG